MQDVEDGDIDRDDNVEWNFCSSGQFKNFCQTLNFGHFIVTASAAVCSLSGLFIPFFSNTYITVHAKPTLMNNTHVWENVFLIWQNLMQILEEVIFPWNTIN